MNQQTRKEDCDMDDTTALASYDTPTPPEQDPSGWPECELEWYGLPARPDRFREPGFYRLWVAAFGKKLRFMKFQTRRAFVVRDYYASPPSKRRGPSTSRFEKSRDWSGLYIEPGRGREGSASEKGVQIRRGERCVDIAEGPALPHLLCCRQKPCQCGAIERGGKANSFDSCIG